MVYSEPGIGGFAAARRSRLSSSPWHTAGSADHHRSESTRDALRRQTQRMLREDMLAQALVNRLCDAVVGDKITFQCKSSDENFNRAAERWFNRWANTECDHATGKGGAGRTLTQLARLAVRACPRDGDSGFVLTDEGRIQHIEAERIRSGFPGTLIDKSKRAKYGGAETIVYGVAFDAMGRVIGYTVSDWDKTSVGAFAQTSVRFIPAEQMLLLRNPANDEPNGTRPEPGLTPLIRPLEQIKQYIAATGVAALAGTQFGWIWKLNTPETPGGGLQESVNFPASTATNSDLSTLTGVLSEPGFVTTVAPNESVEQMKPEHPTQNFADYLITNLAIVSAQQGMPLSLFLMDLRQVNFASAKAAVIQFYNFTVALWREWLRSHGLLPISRWRIAMAIRRGEIDGVSAENVPDDWDNHAFLFKPMPALEPKADAEAIAFRIEKRLITFSDAIAELGMDPEQHMLELAQDDKRMRALGILPVLQPGQMDPNAPAPKPEVKSDDE